MTTHQGKIKRDLDGIPLLHCDRDTNALEGTHSHIKNTFGKQNVGWEFADRILAERRHQGNISTCKTNVLDYPCLEHYDTWLIDAYQLRMDQKYNVLVYPTWVNASSISLETEERFDFVTLATPELQAKINEAVKLKQTTILPPGLSYLSRQVRCVVAPQPWNTMEEKKLFPKLLLNAQHACQNGSNDDMFEHMTYLILPKVDGIKITPKLPVYNRLYYNRFTFNRRVRASAENMSDSKSALNALNILTSLKHVQTIEPLQTEDDTNSIPDTLNEDATDFAVLTGDGSHQNIKQVDTCIQKLKKKFPPLDEGCHLMPAMMPDRLPPIDPETFRPVHSIPYVAGMPIVTGSTVPLPIQHFGREKIQKRESQGNVKNDAEIVVPCQNQDPQKKGLSSAVLRDVMCDDT